MPDEPLSERLKRLEDRIAAAKAGREGRPSRHGSEYTQGSLAWRMGLGVADIPGAPYLRAPAPGPALPAGFKVGVMTAGCVLMTVGLLYAFYAKPVIIRKRKERALREAGLKGGGE